MSRRRTRSREVVSPVQSASSWAQGYSGPVGAEPTPDSGYNRYWNASVATDLPIIDRRDVIIDTVNKKRQRKTQRYGSSPVDHTKVRIVGYQSPNNGSQGHFTTGNRRPQGPWAHPFSSKRWDDILTRLASTTEGEIADFAISAFNEMVTQMPEEISIPNFILEAGELGSLLPDVRTKLSRIEVARNGLLATEFGWKPLISDLEKMSGLLSTIKSRLEFLKSTRGKRVRLGAFQRLDRVTENPISFLHVSTAMNHATGIQWVAHEISRESLLRAGGYLYHELEGLDKLDTFLRAVAAATGWANPLKMVWNALPYSFLVDWVSNVSSLLETAQYARPFIGRWEVQDFSYSVTDRTSGLVMAEPHGEVRPGEPNELPQVVARWEAQRYRRGIGLPARVISLSLPLSAREALLAAALLR